MKEYYEGMIQDVKENYNIQEDSSLYELIVTFQYLLEEYERQEKVINGIQKEINKIFKEYQPINRAVLLAMFENIYKLLQILEDKEVSE